MRFILNAHRVLLSFRFSEIDWRSRRTWTVLILVGLILASLFILLTSGDEQTAQEEVKRMRAVTLASVGSLSSDTTPLPVVGQITSATEANLSAESGGRVTAVYVKLGDTVGAGRIIAETENSGQRAAVLQAEGALDSSKANLAKVEQGARPEERAISQTGVQSAQTSLQQGRSATVNSIRAAYNTNDDLIHTKIDTMFSNPLSNAPKFNITTSDSVLVTGIQNDRVQLETLLKNADARQASLTEGSDLKAELARAQEDSRAVRDFIDKISQALNRAIATQTFPQSTIDGYIATASAARTAISGNLSALSGAAQDLNAKETQVTTSQKQLEQVQTGARSEDVASAQAAVKQAQGAYNAALSNLEKTRVRAPISGTINNLAISRGDFVSPQQVVAVISNNNALEILTYVTEEEQSSVIVGGKVLIEGGIEGTITRVAPALDPVTRKIEVRIGVPDNAGLANGQSVRVEIQRAYDSAQAARAANEPISIPISAVKIEAARTIVFTINAENRLVAHPVVLGPLLGDKVHIREGLSGDLQIVTDARGLKEGEEVSVN